MMRKESRSQRDTVSAAPEFCFHEASYESGDPQDVVAASFACQVCLATPELVVVSLGSAVALAVCGECGAETAVEMTGGQVVHLAVEPPPELALTFVS